MTKYEQYYSDMLVKHKAVFDAFSIIHRQYVLDPQKHKAAFDEKGAEVVEIITDTENRLCAHSEKGKYGVYSNKLAEKFWDLVRIDFPKIDDVGIEITYEPVKPQPVGANHHSPPPQKSLFSQSSDQLADDAIEEVLGNLKITRL